MTEFNDPILAGKTLIRDAIQSENYVEGVSGWAINKDGTAEFNDIIARGTIFIDDGTGATVQIGPSAAILLGADGPDPGVLKSENEVGNVSTTVLQSPTRVEGTNSGRWSELRLRSSNEADTSPGLVTLRSAATTGSTWPDGSVSIVTGTLFVQSFFRNAGYIEAESMRPLVDESNVNITITSLTYITDVDSAVVTFTATASGVVRIDHEFAPQMSFSGTVNGRTVLGTFEIREGTDAGGTVVLAASDNRSVRMRSSGVDGQVYGFQCANFYILSGLTSGDIYTARTLHRVTGTSNTSILDLNRRLTITPQM